MENCEASDTFLIQIPVTTLCTTSGSPCVGLYFDRMRRSVRPQQEIDNKCLQDVWDNPVSYRLNIFDERRKHSNNCSPLQIQAQGLVTGSGVCLFR